MRPLVVTFLLFANLPVWALSLEVYIRNLRAWQVSIANYGNAEEQRKFQELIENVRVLESLERDRKSEQLQNELRLEQQRLQMLVQGWYARNTGTVWQRLDQLVDTTFKCTIEQREPAVRLRCEKDEMKLVLAYQAVSAGETALAAGRHGEAVNAIRSARLVVCSVSERLGNTRDDSFCDLASADYRNRVSAAREIR